MYKDLPVSAVPEVNRDKKAPPGLLVLRARPDHRVILAHKDRLSLVRFCCVLRGGTERESKSECVMKADLCFLCARVQAPMRLVWRVWSLRYWRWLYPLCC